jgi:ribosomal protein S18 acetylase RimI-like enzyme
MTTHPLLQSIRFRPYVEADVPFLRYVYASTRADEMQLVPWTDEQKAAFLNMQFDAQRAHYEQFYPDCEFLVIERDGVPIGRLYIDRGDDIRITDIALVPDVRGQGLGTALLEQILDEARQKRQKVSIYVEHFNPARHLYDRLGFRHTDTNGVYHYMEWWDEAAAPVT